MEVANPMRGKPTFTATADPLCNLGKTEKYSTPPSKPLLLGCRPRKQGCIALQTVDAAPAPTWPCGAPPTMQYRWVVCRGR